MRLSEKEKLERARMIVKREQQRAQQIRKSLDGIKMPEVIRIKRMYSQMLMEIAWMISDLDAEIEKENIKEMFGNIKRKTAEQKEE